MTKRAATAGEGARRAPSDRLDALLAERGLADSRARAQALVMAGLVRVNGEVVTKAGTRVPRDAILTVEARGHYVSRAGEKLAHALDVFDVSAQDRDCLDAGASTGGFTDVLLRRGALRVVSVDVGYGQFAWRLRNDPRVHLLERTNVRHLGGENLPFRPDLLVADLSFISLAVALEKLVDSTPEIREAILLVKPQFEVGPEHVGRGGLVRDLSSRVAAVEKVAQTFQTWGFGAVGLARSPVAGRKSGNREYPLHLVRGVASGLGDDVRRVVEG